MSVGRRTLRLLAGAGVTVMLAGCNFPAPEPVVQPGRLPIEGEDDQSGLQGHELPDECLVGEWVMRTADLDIFLATIVPVPGLRVTAGSLYFVFGPLGEYDYGSEGMVIRIDLSRPGDVPEKFLKGTAFFETAGIYTTDTGALVLTDNGSMVQFTECMAEELVLDVPGPTGAVPMIFKRATR